MADDATLRCSRFKSAVLVLSSVLNFLFFVANHGFMQETV